MNNNLFRIETNDYYEFAEVNLSPNEDQVIVRWKDGCVTVDNYLLQIKLRTEILHEWQSLVYDTVPRDYNLSGIGFDYHLGHPSESPSQKDTNEIINWCRRRKHTFESGMSIYLSGWQRLRAIWALYCVDTKYKLTQGVHKRVELEWEDTCQFFKCEDRKWWFQS